VVRHSEAGPDRSAAAGARRVRNPDTRVKVLVRSPRTMKIDQAGDIRQRVQRLERLAGRHRGALPADTKVQCQIVSQPPVVVRIEKRGPLVPVVARLAQIALREIVRHMIQQIFFQRAPVVITPLPLYEVLRGNYVAAIETQLESVLALRPIDIVDKLVGILDSELWRVGIRADL